MLEVAIKTSTTLAAKLIDTVNPISRAEMHQITIFRFHVCTRCAPNVERDQKNLEPEFLNDINVTHYDAELYLIN